jgi:hypothetical protein
VLTFVVGTASDVFPPDFAQTVEALLKDRYGFAAAPNDEAYRSEGVSAGGWRELQELATSMLGSAAAKHLTGVEAYQAVYLPATFESIDQVTVPNAADPIQVASLPALLAELSEFAARAQLPTDELELMGLAADYLEAESEKELDFQTYVQLMLSAKQAVARKQPLWIVT